jgi:hypothetical protein
MPLKGAIGREETIGIVRVSRYFRFTREKKAYAQYGYYFIHINLLKIFQSLI